MGWKATDSIHKPEKHSKFCRLQVQEVCSGTTSVTLSQHNSLSSKFCISKSRYPVCQLDFSFHETHHFSYRKIINSSSRIKKQSVIKCCSTLITHVLRHSTFKLLAQLQALELAFWFYIFAWRSDPLADLLWKCLKKLPQMEGKDQCNLICMGHILSYMMLNTDIKYSLLFIYSETFANIPYSQIEITTHSFFNV